MSNDVQVNLSGDKALKMFLADALPKTGKAGIRKSAREAIRPVSKRQKYLTPDDRTGLLKKSETTKVKVYASGTVVAMAGVNRAIVGSYQGRRIVPNKYLHLVDRGTGAHGNHPGAAGKYMIERSYEETKSEAKAIFEETLQGNIMKAAAKEAAKKNAK